MWYIHRVGYCSVIKRNEVLIPATTWVNFENIMLNERSQTQKTKYYMTVHLYEISRIGKSIETEGGLVVGCQGVGGMMLKEFEISFCSDEKVLELHGGDGHTTL